MKQGPRAILPAASILPNPQQPHVESPSAKIAKRQAVQRACNGCRKIKCKCDGNRPVCAKCLDRQMECVYDTIEGMSRSASLRKTNEALAAKIERYKDIFEDLLSDNPSRETVHRIKDLGLSPDVPGRRDSTGDHSHDGSTPSLGYDSNQRQGSLPDLSLPQGREWLSEPELQIDALGGGYDPNDGRISGKQDGWHHMLVIIESQSLISAETTETMEMPNNGEYRPSFRRATSLSVARQAPWNEAEEIGMFNDHYREPSADTPWKHPKITLNGGAESAPFYPPPGAITAYGNLPMSSAVLANGYPRPTQRRQLLNFRVPEHTIPPLIVEESSELAKMYLGFKDAALEMIGNGMSAKQILGDADEIVLDLFFRPRVATDPYTVCNWACELIRNIPGFDVYMQLAWIALLTRFMRWIIHPTADNYARIPPMMRPIKVQRLIPHSPALDLCPHPGMRQALMQSYRDWLTPNQTQNGAMTCWAGTLENATMQSPRTGSLILTAQFEHHTQIKDNWTVTTDITEAFPRAASYGITVREDTSKSWRTNGKTMVRNGSYSETESFDTMARGERRDKMTANEAEISARIYAHEQIRVDQKKLRLAKYPPPSQQSI